MSTNKLLDVSLKLLKITGMNPYDNDTITKIKRFVFILTNTLSCLDFLLICLFDWKGFDSIAEITIYISFAHVGYKLTSLMVKRYRYLEIFQLMNKFTRWESLQSCIKEDVDKTVNTLLKIIHSFQIVIVTAGMGYTLTPLFSSKRQTPLESHFSKYFDNTLIYISIYVLHTFDFYLEALSILGHDILYISLISSINIEIQIFKDRLQKFIVNDDADEDKIEEMSQIVVQHNLILKVIKRCNLVYTDVLLMQFFTSIIFLATVLATLMDGGFPPPMGSVFTFGLHLSSSMFQLFIYCTLGQILINQDRNDIQLSFFQTQSIADAVYNIKWWIKPQPKVRQACILIIQRANKLDCLSAAGMLIVNYESYTKVLKFGLSLFSLTQAMKARNEHIDVTIIQNN